MRQLVSRSTLQSWKEPKREGLKNLKAGQDGLPTFMAFKTTCMPLLLERGCWHVAAGWSSASPSYRDAMNAGRPELDHACSRVKNRNVKAMKP